MAKLILSNLLKELNFKIENLETCKHAFYDFKI